MVNKEQRQAEYELLLRYLNVMEDYLVEKFELSELQDIANKIGLLNKVAERNQTISIEDFLEKYYEDDPEVNLATTQIFEGCNKYINDRNILTVVPFDISKPGSNKHWQTISEHVASAVETKYFIEHPNN